MELMAGNPQRGSLEDVICVSFPKKVLLKFHVTFQGCMNRVLWIPVGGSPIQHPRAENCQNCWGQTVRGIYTCIRM